MAIFEYDTRKRKVIVCDGTEILCEIFVDEITWNGLDHDLYFSGSHIGTVHGEISKVREE